MASFFVSRIDTLIDDLLRRRLENPAIDRYQRRVLEALRGTVAVANAKLAYQSYQRMLASPRWKAWPKGAQTQRLLWASTRTRIRRAPDVKRRRADRTGHGQHRAARDTCRVPRSRQRASTLTENVDEARHIMETLENIGISSSKSPTVFSSMACGCSPTRSIVCWALSNRSASRYSALR